MLSGAVCPAPSRDPVSLSTTKRLEKTIPFLDYRHAAQLADIVLFLKMWFSKGMNDMQGKKSLAALVVLLIKTPKRPLVMRLGCACFVVQGRQMIQLSYLPQNGHTIESTACASLTKRPTDVGKCSFLREQDVTVGRAAQGSRHTDHLQTSDLHGSSPPQPGRGTRSGCTESNCPDGPRRTGLYGRSTGARGVS